MATCSGCGADIIWAVTEHGKRIPLNKPEKRFILVLVRSLGIPWGNEVDQGDHYEARMRETYTSHFSSCPNADEFRKEKS